MSSYPHLNSGKYPHIDNVDVYGYDYGDFDFSRWNKGSKIKLCAVPWDERYDHVVKFESNDARDSYFETIPGCKIELDSSCRVLPTGEIKLPVPVNAAMLYNYVVVDVPVMIDSNDPLNNATPAVRRFLFFVNSCEYIAPSTTKFIISLDHWATYINELVFSQMIVERGHYGMFKMPTSTYLQDPLNNSDLLLTPDLTYGDIQRVRSSCNLVLNEEVYVCIATNANVKSDWGAGPTKTTPGLQAPLTDGAPAPYIFAMETSDFVEFLQKVDANYPQFKSAVLGVFFIPKNMVKVYNIFTFGDISCYDLKVLHNVTQNIFKISKNDFSFDEKIDEMAKLYTYPYSALEVTDEEGNTSLVRIEDTSGVISFKTNLSFVFPYIKITGTLDNVGGTVSSIVSFSNVSANILSVSGRWYANLQSWDVPIYQITQSSRTNASYNGYYSRQQQQTSANNAYASATASNATANTNVHNSATTSRSNNSVTVAANNAITSRTIAANVTGARYSNDKLVSDANYDALVAAAGYASDIDGVALNATMNNANALGSVVSTIGNAAMGGAAAGPVGAAGAAIGSLAATGASWVAGNISNSVAATKIERLYDQTQTSAVFKTTNATNYTTNSTNLNNSTTSANNTTNSNTATTITNNNANLATTNADNTKATADANASRSLSTAESAVANSIKQMSLNAPYTFGSSSNNGLSTVRPLMLSCNVVTQSNNAIMQAATQFARYGYTLGIAVDFETFNLGKNYTYWQCSDVWLRGTQCVTEGISDVIINILKKGTTVWNDPLKIGKVDIYDNFPA